MTDHELQQALLDRLAREPHAPEPRRRSFLDTTMTLLCIGLGLAILWLIAEPYIRPQAAPQAAPTPYPTAYQPASAPQAAPQIIYRDAPAEGPQATAGAVIVVTPTFATGCYDGIAYINGVATNGACAGAAYAPEEATATVELRAATAVPPDPTYLQTIKDQQPHKIR